MNLSNEKGYTLVSVLLVVMLLVILGGTYMVVSSTEIRQSIIHSDRVQAYYFARSGAEVGSEWIRGNFRTELTTVGAQKAINGDLSSLNLSDNSSSTSKISVLMERVNEDFVRIASTGRYNGREQTTTLFMRRLPMDELFEQAVYSTEDFDADKAQVEIIGDVVSKGQIYGEENIDGDIFPFSEVEYYAMDFPEGITEPGTAIDVGAQNSPYFIDKEFIEQYEYANENGKSFSALYFSDIEVRPNRTLYIDAGCEGDITEIIVDYIYIQGSLELINEGCECDEECLGGTVYLYIRGGQQVRTPSSEVGTLIIVLAPEAELTIQTPGSAFNGYVYGPESTVNLQADALIKGAVIVGEISQQSQVYGIEFTRYPHLDIEFLKNKIPRNYRRDTWLD